MKSNIIGREKEIQELEDVYNSKKSEFVAICGRRRVGKTFLIEELFENEIVFKTAGVANASKLSQLKTFYRELIARGLPPEKEEPKDWIDAFFMLRSFLERQKSKRKVVVIDELPWFDTPKSGFMQALENFWNSWAASQHNIILIVCGSATSWMMNTLINNYGGLYNRVTCNIFLNPFTLKECERMLQEKGFNLSRYEIAELYMIFGGIPFYIDKLKPDMSLSQNIDNLLFRPNGSLRNEFDNLYKALFKNSEDYVKVVSALYSRKAGLTRKEILETTGINSGGGITEILKNLTWCGFIRPYDEYKAGRGEDITYQLVDFYTLFYFQFIKPGRKSSGSWTNIQGKPEFNSWAGISFERLAVNHISQIKQKLGISGVETSEYSWRDNTPGEGAQIDLVIERADNTVNICEIKFSVNEFSIDNDYEMNLRNKIARFINLPRFSKSVQLTFISTYGVKRNTHSGIVNNEVVLDDLFA